jgi:hypothetical protein
MCVNTTLLFACLLSSRMLLTVPARASSAASDPREHIGRVLAAEGLTLADAHIETVTWRRVERFVGASGTAALLGGTYNVYAAGERPEDRVNLTIVNRADGTAIGQFSLGGGLPARSGTIVVRRASILALGIEPARLVVNRRMATYNVALGFVRRAPPSKPTGDIASPAWMLRNERIPLGPWAGRAARDVLRSRKPAGRQPTTG